MEKFLLLVIVFMLIDIEGKLNREKKKDEKKNWDLKSYLNKEVYIVLDNDDVDDAYLFSAISKTVGVITDFDEEWFVLKFYHKDKRMEVTEFLRIGDLESIGEIKKLGE